MVMFDNIFAGKSGVAQGLLKLMGIKATITMPSSYQYDPSTGVDVETTGNVYTAKCAPPASYNVNEINGSNILQGDVKLTIGTEAINGESYKDLERATVEVNSKVFNVVNVNPIVSGEDTPIIILQLRQ